MTKLFWGMGVALLATLCVAQAQHLTLPIDRDKAAADWDISSDVLTVSGTGNDAFYATTADRGPIFPTPVVRILSKNKLQPPFVIEGKLRLPADVRSITRGFSRATVKAGIQVGLDEKGKPLRYQVAVSRGRARDAYSWAATIVAPGERNRAVQFTPVYTLDDISPLMDDDVRLILERRVDDLPVAHEQVYRLRFEVHTDRIRAFVNGRYIGERTGKFTASQIAVDTHNEVELHSLLVTPLADFPARFETLGLDSFANSDNGRRIMGMEMKGGFLGIDGVPFDLIEISPRGDHVDLGPSLYLHRMGSYRDGDSRQAVHLPEKLDVTRFTMRVPPGTWRRAWVIAGYDGDPAHTPELTLRFYRPRTPWVTDASVQVPSLNATSAPGGAIRLPWTVFNTTKSLPDKSLWLIPIDLDTAALAADPMDCLELTKKIYPYRGYPDPAYSNSYPGGLPSGVHIYGLTLEEAPVKARATGTANANLYIGDEPVIWRVLAENLTDKLLNIRARVEITGPYGTHHDRHTIDYELLAKLGEQELKIPVDAPVFGLYTVVTTITVGDFTQTRTGTFLRLPKATRKATPLNSPWGLWCWNGGHDTNPDTEDNLRILQALGAINSFKLSTGRGDDITSLYPLRQKYGIGAEHYRLVDRKLPAWASEDPYDPEEYAKFAEEKGLEAAQALKDHPDLKYVNLFAENYISLRLTHGMSPWAMGQPWFEYNASEGPRLRAHWLTAKAAAEGVRKHAPSLKILFGHGAGNFAQPFFREPDWDNDRFDGFGMDLPQFERMPERQPRATEPSLLYFLHHQMKEKKATGKDVVHLESYFPSSGPLALTFQEQADSIPRTAVLSMSMGTTQFMRTWELHTSGDGWGGSHYGSCGLIDRAPEFNPKPAAAAYATMARVLDTATYDGFLYVDTRGSFCLRFRDTDDRLIYPVWTTRGQAQLQLTVTPDATVTRTDMHGNTFPVASSTVTISPSIQWLEVRGGEITTARSTSQTYPDDKPAKINRPLDLGKHWTYDPSIHERFQNNHWDMPREPGKMVHTPADGLPASPHIITLTKPDMTKPMVGFYGQLVPKAPIPIPGKAKALGLNVAGHSAWNRIIYEITDAKGEVWINTGTKDAWNCDDIHSWSSVNHDGLRYLRFPLPSSAPGDNFREADTVWWGSDGDGVVDLPLSLTRIIIEMRPQMIYVNKMIPLSSYSLKFFGLTAEYANEEDTTDAPIKLQQLAAKTFLQGKPKPLPNPYADLQKNATAPAPTITAAYPPDEQQNNGTRLFLEVDPIPGATTYHGYVSAYPDGSGAKALGITQTSGGRYAKLVHKPNAILFNGLQPARPMYLFVTAVDADGNESRPSALREVTLKDEFPFK